MSENKPTFHRAEDPEAGGVVVSGEHEEFLTKDEAVSAGYVEEEQESVLNPTTTRQIGKNASKYHSWDDSRKKREAYTNRMNNLDK